MLRPLQFQTQVTTVLFCVLKFCNISHTLTMLLVIFVWNSIKIVWFQLSNNDRAITTCLYLCSSITSSLFWSYSDNDVSLTSLNDMTVAFWREPFTCVYICPWSEYCNFAMWKYEIAPILTFLIIKLIISALHSTWLSQNYF